MSLIMAYDNLAVVQNTTLLPEWLTLVNFIKGFDRCI